MNYRFLFFICLVTVCLPACGGGGGGPYDYYYYGSGGSGSEWEPSSGGSPALDGSPYGGEGGVGNGGAPQGGETGLGGRTQGNDPIPK